MNDVQRSIREGALGLGTALQSLQQSGLEIEVIMPGIERMRDGRADVLLEGLRNGFPLGAGSMKSFGVLQQVVKGVREPPTAS
jgi:hypothetical protein